jgi:hypothetical protein
MDCLTRIAIEDTKHDLCDISPCADCLHEEGFNTEEELDYALMSLELTACLIGKPSPSFAA